MPDLLKRLNDLGVIAIAPTSPTDARIPMAEEFALSEIIGVNLYRQTREGSQGWLTVPSISITNPRTVVIGGGVASSAIYPTSIPVATSVAIPALSSTSATIKQTQHLQLVVFAAQIGVPHDPSLSITFNYQESPSSPVQSVTKENSRRSRSYWLLVLSPDRLTPASFNTALTSSSLTITNTANEGFALGSLQIYAKDSNLVTGVPYPIYTDVTDVIPLVQIERLQNTTEQGYTWGANGEENLDPAYHVALVGNRVGRTPSEIVRNRLIDVMVGRPGAGSTYARTVRNLTASISIRPDRPGVASDAPNGSINLSNSQRVTFTNQAFLERYGVQQIAAGNDGSGNALLAAVANTAGATFSENAADHKVFSSAGVDETANGRFLNLGGVGSLTWVAGANSTIVPGLTAYFVPAIRYPAGSGFSVPFEVIERAWNGVTEISPANILLPENDLSDYATPANSEDFFLVTGSERAAIHYVLRKVSVTSNGSGVAVVAPGTFGNFAFIEGVSGRINTPVRTGLTPNTTFNALQYYAPRTIEQWQFQMRVCEYQGLGNSQASWLNGAEIASVPIVYFHTKGGGESCFRGDGTFRFIPVAMQLPQGNAPSYSYNYNYAVQFVGSTYSAADAIREVSPLPASGLSLPTPGQVLTFTSNNSVSPRSIAGRVATAGRTLGFKVPALEGGKEAQSVIGFLVRKDGESRLLVATFNGVGGTDIQIDSASGTGFDLFRV